MQLILLEKVRNLGDVGDQVRVKHGYGRNYLIPQGKAVQATKSNIAYFDQKKAELQQAEQEKYNQALERSEKLNNIDKVVIYARASAEGKLYGSIGPAMISEAVSKHGVEIERREVELATGPLRYIGEYDVNIVLHSEVEMSVHIEVQPEA